MRGYYTGTGEVDKEASPERALYQTFIIKILYNPPRDCRLIAL